MTTETELLKILRRTTPRDSTYAQNAGEAADLIERQAAEIAARDETIRRLRDALAELLAALDDSASAESSQSSRDEIAAMVRYANAESAVRAALKDAP